MSFLTQFISQKQTQYQFVQLYYKSGTWTAPSDGTVTFIAVGAGGRGGFTAYQSPQPYPNYLAPGQYATGGGAGGFAQKTLSVNANATFTITVGAATPHGSPSGPGLGGNTIISTNSGLLAANIVGGGGSAGSAGLSPVPITVAGGAGGTATGGDFNIPGGAGGNVVTTSPGPFGPIPAIRLTGGGAVGVSLPSGNTPANNSGLGANVFTQFLPKSDATVFAKYTLGIANDSFELTGSTVGGMAKFYGINKHEAGCGGHGPGDNNVPSNLAGASGGMFGGGATSGAQSGQIAYGGRGAAGGGGGAAYALWQIGDPAGGAYGGGGGNGVVFIGFNPR